MEREREVSRADRADGNLVGPPYRDSSNGGNITKDQLLANWQAVRAMGAEMREWMRLYGRATGELVRDGQNHPTMGVTIVCPDCEPSGVMIDTPAINIALPLR